MFKNCDLFSVFHLNQINHIEFTLVLSWEVDLIWISHYFREVCFYKKGRPENEYIIKLIYNKNDQIKSVEVGPYLTDAIFANIIAAIESKLMLQTEQRVSRKVLFSEVPLSGGYRFKDKFQILPLPDCSPKLQYPIGKHPFDLEAIVSCSATDMVTATREIRIFREFELLLSGFVDSSIHSMTGASHQWVLLPGEDLQSAYLQETYNPRRKPFGPSYSDFKERIPSFEPEELFNSGSRIIGRPIRIPNNIDQILSNYFLLEESKRQTILRSCYWIQHAKRIFHYSSSAAFMAIVTAVEVFFENIPETKCVECGQRLVRGKSKSAQFAEFLDCYVPLDEFTDHMYGQKSFRERLKHLYNTRSVITHGDHLLSGDNGDLFAFRPVASQERDDVWTLMRIMPYALGKLLLNIGQDI